MNTKPLTFLLAIAFLFLCSSSSVLFADGSKDAPEEVLDPKVMEMINAFTESKKNTTYLFICNQAEYVDRADKKRRLLRVMASASVTIQVGQKKAELRLGTKTNSLISTRANHDMDLTVELKNGEYVFTGLEDTGNPETGTYFSYFTKKKDLLASYVDVVVYFKGCVDMGIAVTAPR